MNHFFLCSTKQVLLAILLLGATLIVVPVATISVMATLNKDSTVVSNNLLPSVKVLGQISTETANLRAAEAKHIITITQNRVQVSNDQIDEIKTSLSRLLAIYEQLVSSEQERALYSNFIEEYANYLHTQEKLLILSSLDQNADANRLFLTDSLVAYRRMTEALSHLTHHNEMKAIKMSQHSDEVFNTTHRLVFMLTLISSVVIMILFLLLLKKLIQNRDSTENRVSKALISNAFHCAYQPIFDMKENRVIGVEVLARLSDDRGDIFPDTFIPIIASKKQTWLFTTQIVTTALGELQQLKASLKDFKVSFNIFPDDVNNNQIRHFSSLSGVQNFEGDIALEITESELLEQEIAKEHMRKIVAEGFNIAIDDFGTGYSNFHQLKAVSAQYLKIDRSFVIDMEVDSIKSALIRHILPIASELNMEVIVEGVENETQHLMLKEMGVEFGQGWYYGKPEKIERLKQRALECSSK